MIIATDGSCLYNGERRARAGAGVYVEGRQDLCRSFRLPEELEQSNQTGEITATLLASTAADERTRVIQETDSQTTMFALTKWRSQHEDTGYILQKNAGLTRTTIARLRMRKAHTVFRWVRGHSGHSRNEEADRLAALGAEKESRDDLNLDIPDELKVSGAKLQAISQKLAYRAIRKRKDALVKPRPSAVANIDRITCGIQGAFDVQVQEASIWVSFRSRHVARPVSQFLWMAVHDGYMIGKYWLRPSMAADLQQRATCAICGECETMTHIIFECGAVGQERIWNLLKTLWTLTKAKWHEPSWGVTFGAACAVFKTEDGARKTAIEHLWCILCSEALHLIWKMRCERVIQREGKEFTEPEVTNRFYATMESRLSLDRRTAAMARGKRALKSSDVVKIWSPVIENIQNLPLKWVTDSGVLVGIKRGG
ncbi:ribonuclease H-like protein [Polyporus arcularius HHB13444]|uniref:ribonuclease H n=1 Tax=Polyporus arcularius HHB13444 TaxID=1314778 RepID=A0A5C3PVS4_9APHY|nr:ribonuclease H-like protein [Polyporus arcularius HHB13444]